MEELRIKIKLDFKDFLNFQYWYLRKKYLTRLIFIGIFLLSIVVLVPLFLGGSINTNHLSSFIPSLTFILFVPLFLVTATYFGAKKSFNNDPQIQKAQEYIFNSAGIQFSTENSQTKLIWDELFKFEESKSNLMIYCSPIKCYILPKEQLNDSELSFIRATLKENLITKPIKSNSVFPKPLRFALILIIIIISVFSGLHKDKSEEYFDIGYSKTQARDYEGAIADYTKAIQENPDYAMAYNFRGHAKGMLRDYTGELEDCSKAIDLDGDNGYAYYNRGMAKYFLNDSVGACTDYHKADEAGFWDAKKAIEGYCK